MTASKVTQAVPFFHVTDIAASLRFYVDGLGATLADTWEPSGRIRWCRLTIGDAALMLQEYLPDRIPPGPLGQGVCVCLICTDALAVYRDVTARGIEASRPFVGNGLWVTSVIDPDGYRIDFESATDVPEETVYSP